MSLSGGDVTHIVYQGPPRWTGSQWVNGDRFHLSGRPYQAQEGVELSPGAEGLERPTEEYRYNTTANIPGMEFVDSIAGKREIMCSINIFGDSPAHFRDVKNKWMRNHISKDPGKLWFISSNSMPRYLSCRMSEKAGVGSIEQDQALLRRIDNFEWGWVSSSPYFFGFRETVEFKHLGGGDFYARVYNPSTASQVYPSLYLPGPGKWTFSLGFERRDFQTPTLKVGEEAKIDFHPKKQTFLHRAVDGKVTNLWPQMVGQRPKRSLEAETWTDFTAKHEGDVSLFKTVPKLVFTPEYVGWN